MTAMLTPMLPPGSYADARAAFRWPVTDAMNMGAQTVDAPAAAAPDATAVLEWSPQGVVRHSRAALRDIIDDLADSTLLDDPDPDWWVRRKMAAEGIDAGDEDLAAAVAQQP